MNVVAARAEDTELDERRLELTLAQVAPLRWQVLVTTACVVALAWSSIAPALLAPWAAAMLVGRELRARRLAALLARHAEPTARRLRQARWDTLVVGVPMGAAAAFIPWLDRASAAVLTMVLVSISAAAVSAISLLPGAFRVYGVCTLVPAALAWCVGLDALSIALGALLLMFLGVQVRSAEANRQTFETSFRIRRDNEQLMRQLAQARDTAEAASRAKTRFLAAASHDLRQPLHALALQSASLAMDPSSPDTPRIAQAMSRAIGDLSALLDSLLDVSKLDAGTVRVERRAIRLDRLLRSVGDAFRGAAQAKGLELDVQAPAGVVVETDPVLFERLARNLVDNAIKYTERGRVGLTLQRDADTLVVRVTDTGCGIAEDQQARVFDEFYRVDAHHDSGGLGLGLSIVRRLAELLDVELQLHSTPGHGTEVTLRLAATAAAAAPSELPAATSAVDLAGLHVLVVDDEPAVLDATRTLLLRLGCSVDTASASAAAHQCAHERAPDVLLTDYRLRQHETGIELARRIRADHPGVTALLISGDTGPDRLQEAAASGLPVLHKPLSAPRLVAAIAAALPPGWRERRARAAWGPAG